MDTVHLGALAGSPQESTGQSDHVVNFNTGRGRGGLRSGVDLHAAAENDVIMLLGANDIGNKSRPTDSSTCTILASH